MRVARRVAEIDSRNPRIDELDIGGIREGADMRTALEREAFITGGIGEEIDERRMRDRTVQGATPMEAVEAHGGPAAEADITAPSHLRRIGCKNDIELDRDIGRQRLCRRERAAKVELLLHREHEV